ncbi:MAG: tetratricopeptide repeat protein [Bacteroidetes bacterium]|nr:tetratricopeptide repeat protein [Bacteroidota bacterium]
MARLAPVDKKENLLKEAENLVEPGSESQARLFREWAIFFVIKRNFSNCLAMLDKARIILESREATSELAYLYHMYVELYTSIFDNITANKYGLKALEVSKTLDDDELIGYSYLALSHALPYRQSDNEYIHKAISFLKSSNSRFLGHAYNNLGYRYYLNGKLDSSLVYYQNAIAIKEETGDITVGNTLSNLADLYLAMEQYSKTIETSRLALNWLEPQGDTENVVLCYVSRIQAHLALDNIEYALNDVKITDSLLVDIPDNNYELKKIYYQTKKDLARALNSPEDYFDYDQKYTQATDSLQVQKDSTFNSQIEIQKELLESATKMNLLQQEISYRQRVNIALLAILLLGLFVILLLLRNKKIRKKFEKKRIQLLDQKRTTDKLEINNLLKSKALQEEETKRVEDKLEYRKRQLSTSTLIISQKNAFLKSLSEIIQKGIEENQSTRLIQKLKHKIDQQLLTEDDWKNLKLQFEEIHPNFFQRLTETHPSISSNDRRLCAFIRMQLSNKEIARIMGVNAASVLKSRYRLRKKLELDKETDLSHYIINF